MKSNLVNLLNIKDELIIIQEKLWEMSSNDREVEDNLESIGTNVETALKIVNRKLAIEEQRQLNAWGNK